MKKPDRNLPRESTSAALPTVVVCDDDAQILSSLRRALRSEPYEVLVTEDPFQALEWIKSRAVDLVIADEFMPAMRGSELLEAITRYAPRSAKVILTGYPDAVASLPGGKEGSNLVIPKPWEEEYLRRSVRLLLEASGAQAF